MAEKKEEFSKDESKRIEAINQHLKGENPTKICTSLGKSRVWFYKWLKRYQDIGEKSRKKWFREESRAPINVHRKTDSKIESIIVHVRESLVEGKDEDTKYRCIGAEEIQFRMHELQHQEDMIPSLSTIKRIIKRNKLVIQKKKRYVRCKSQKRYTLLDPTKINEVHQIDFVGPRHIEGYGSMSSLNLIDVVGRRAHIQQYVSRSMNCVTEFLLKHWTKGIPRYLQMDNGAYFIGGLIHLRHFSRVVRLCLYFGVEPVFIAQKKPWMNGSVEDFNGDFGENFWEREKFKNLEHAREEAKIFLKHHNNRQKWKQRKKNLEVMPICKIPKDLKTNVDNLPLTEGKVHFIREVTEKGFINVLNEDFFVDESLSYEYVWATINTKEEKMYIYHREKGAKEARLVKFYEYKISNEVVSRNTHILKQV